MDEIQDELEPFILEHEKGHFLLQTRDEIKADKYASDHFLGKYPGSLKNSVFALTRVLPGKPQQVLRMKEQLKRALLYDYIKNNNTKAMEILKKLEADENNDNFLMANFDETIFEDFGGRRRAVKAEKQRLKDELGKDWRKTWKQEKKEGVKTDIFNQLKQDKAEEKGKRDAAKLGLSEAPTAAATIASATPPPADPDAEAKKKKQKTMLIGGGIALAVIVIVVVVYFKFFRS